MTGKKITFSEKPNARDAEKIIDQWIFGEEKDGNNVKNNALTPNLKRTTIYLPEKLRQEIKLMAVNKDTTMTELIIEALNKFLH